MRKVVFLTIITVLFIEIIFAIVAVYFGFADVSAASSEGSIGRWFLGTVRDRSIHSRALDIVVPSLDDSILVMKGFDHYNEMCVTCHGAPGLEPGELAQGLNPPAPVFAHSSSNRNAAETFLIVKNGIKMTGMPAWAPTHDDSAIWAMVAFLRHLPQLTPEKYRALQKMGHSEEMENMDHR